MSSTIMKAFWRNATALLAVSSHFLPPFPLLLPTPAGVAGARNRLAIDRYKSWPLFNKPVLPSVSVRNVTNEMNVALPYD